MKGVGIWLEGVQTWLGVNIRHQEVIQWRFMKGVGIWLQIREGVGGGNMAKGGAKVVKCKYYTPRSTYS